MQKEAREREKSYAGVSMMLNKVVQSVGEKNDSVLRRSRLGGVWGGLG